MSGFNLPPGVSSNDIPGNRPQDTAAERISSLLEDAAYQAVSWGWTEKQFLDEAKSCFNGSTVQMEESIRQIESEPDEYYDHYYEAEEEE